MVQLAYPTEPPIGAPGLIVDSTPWRDIITKIVSDNNPPGPIGFGLFVTHDAGNDDELARFPANSAEVTGGGFGFSIKETGREFLENQATGTGAGFDIGEPFRHSPTRTHLGDCGDHRHPVR